MSKHRSVAQNIAKKSLLLIGPNFHHFNQSVQRAFEQLGWDVSLCAYDTPITPYGLSNKIRYKVSKDKELLKNKSRISFSEQVKETFCTLNPQLVFLLNGEMLSSEVVEYMQKQCPVIIWLYDSITRLPHCWNILPHCSNVFCYEQEDIPLIREKLSIECGFISQAVDPELYYSLEDTNKKWEVVFAADIWQSEKRKQFIQKVVSEFSTAIEAFPESIACDYYGTSIHDKVKQCFGTDYTAKRKVNHCHLANS